MSYPQLPPELDPRGPRRAPRRVRPPRPVGAAPGGSGGPGGRRRWPLVVTGAASAVVLVFSAVGSGLASYYESQTQRVDAIIGGSAAAGSAQNYLLVGSDNRAGLSAAQIAHLHVGAASAANGSGRRSDTMILLHLSAGTDKATLISLPRDSYVTIPAYTDDQGRRQPASRNKLNAAYSLGGPKLAVATVELATGVHIDHYVEIGFGGFVKMVTAVGGVPVCSTVPLRDPKSGLNIKSGTTMLNGTQALEYVRARYVDATSDLGRMKRQQAFLGSLFRTALSTQVLLNPLKLNSVLTATLSSVTLDTGLTRDDLLTLATRTKGLAPSNVVFATVPIADVNYQPSAALGSTVLWDHTRAAQLFAAIRADQPIGGQTSKATAATGTPVAVASPRITVQVLNGGGVTGAGAKAAADLTKLGFVMAGPAGNATQQGLTQTLITYDPAYSESVKTLQAAFPDAAVKAVRGQGKVFQVIVGTGYHSPKPVSATSATGGTAPGGVKTTSAAQTVCKTS